MPSLAQPTFTTEPDEELAAIDVYEQTSSEVVNSYQEFGVGMYEQEPGLLDSLSNIDPREMLSQATQALGTASKIAAALSAFQSGSNPLGALASGMGGMANMGMGPASQAMRQASQMAGALTGIGQARSISQMLGVGGRMLGPDGATINKLAYSTSTIERNLSSFRYLNGSSTLSNISRGLALGAGMTQAVGSILGDMSPSMTNSYNSAARSAISIAPTVQRGTVVVGRARDAGNADVITRAVSEFRGETYQTRVTDSAGLAGTIAGLSFASHLSGVPGTFKTLTDGVDDMRVCKAAAVPLAREAAATGDVNLFMDIAASKVAPQMLSSVPELASGMVSTVRPPPELAQQEYSRLYDNFDTSLQAVSPNWKTYNRGGTTVVNAAYVAQNPFMQDMIAAKMNAVMGGPGSNDQSVYPQNSVYSMASNEGVTIDPMTAVNNQIASVNEITLEAAPAAVVGETAEEVYMMLASVFPAESVDSGVKEHFPFFHATLDQPLIGIPV